MLALWVIEHLNVVEYVLPCVLAGCVGFSPDALAYGLTRDELCSALDPADVMGPDYPSETFRVLKSNGEKKFAEYRTRRLVLVAYDELMAKGLRPRLEGDQ